MFHAQVISVFTFGMKSGILSRLVVQKRDMRLFSRVVCVSLCAQIVFHCLVVILLIKATLA